MTTAMRVFILAMLSLNPLFAANAEEGTAASTPANANSGPSLEVKEGTFTPAQMPTNSDRAQKSKAAAAAAKAGSAMQQVTCMKMQADAAATFGELVFGS